MQTEKKMHRKQTNKRRTKEKTENIISRKGYKDRNKKKKKKKEERTREEGREGRENEVQENGRRVSWVWRVTLLS